MPARRLLERISLLRIDDVLLDQAAALEGATLRSLDAVHLAAVQILGSELVEVITHDQRMADAAHRIGRPVVAPS